MSRSSSFLVAALVMPGVLRAQQLRGSVRELGASAPLPGAVVTAVDSAGANTTRAMADGQGRFAITLPLHAARLHVVRIGFRPRDVAIPASLDTPVDVGMERIPPILEAVKVSDKELCPGSVERGAAFALWEQARDGLLAAVVARELKPAMTRMLSFDRRLHPGDELVGEQHTRMQTGWTTRPFISSAGASYFATVGYMTDEGANGRVYHAPDADVLLDPAFAATHCFRLQRADRDHEGQIGLAFVPAPGRDTLVEVTGVVWLDAATPQLRTFDFLYTSLEPAATSMHAGGHLEFRTMPNGVSFIERWSIRLPILAATAGDRATRPYEASANRRQNQNNVRLAAISEAGGVVLDAQWQDGAAWHTPATVLAGEVLQRNSPLPVSHAIVSLAGTSDSATTDSAGHFELKVLPGKYTIRAADTLLREFVADRSESREVTAERDKVTNVRIEVDRVANVVADVCRGQDMGNDHAIIIGHTSAVGGRLPRESHVVAEWQNDYVVTADKTVIQGKRQATPIDDKGRFVVCGVVRERPIHLRLYAGADDLVADTTFKIYDARLTYVLPWRVTGDVMTGGATLTGTVLGADQRPVSGATVQLSQLQRAAVTDTLGHFQIGALKPGSYSVEVRRMGYPPVRDSVTLAARAEVVRDFSLRPAAALDTIRAIGAAPQYVSAKLREFDARSRTGQGTFIVDSVLRRNESQRMSDVLRAFIPSVQIQTSGSSAYVVSVRDSRVRKRPFEVTVASPELSHCYATVYLDGLLLFDLATADPTGAPPNINEFRVSDFTGIEYHPGDGVLPPQFRSSECGTLLMWTREK